MAGGPEKLWLEDVNELKREVDFWALKVAERDRFYTLMFVFFAYSAFSTQRILPLLFQRFERRSLLLWDDALSFTYAIGIFLFCVSLIYFFRHAMPPTVKHIDSASVSDFLARESIDPVQRAAAIDTVRQDLMQALDHNHKKYLRKLRFQNLMTQFALLSAFFLTVSLALLYFILELIHPSLVTPS